MPEPSSALFDRLKRVFDEGHGVELPDLRDDARFAPAEIRPAAVLIAVETGMRATWSADSRGGCSRPYESVLRRIAATTCEIGCRPSSSTA